MLIKDTTIIISQLYAEKNHHLNAKQEEVFRYQKASFAFHSAKVLKRPTRFFFLLCISLLLFFFALFVLFVFISCVCGFFSL